MNIKGSWESCGICDRNSSSVTIVDGCDKTYCCWKCYKKISSKPYAVERQKKTAKCRGIQKQCAICGKLFEMQTPQDIACSRTCRDKIVKAKRGEQRASHTNTLTTDESSLERIGMTAIRA